MIFEKDRFFLGLRFIVLTLITFSVIYIFNQFLLQKTNFGVNSFTLYVIIIVIIFFVQFFLTSTVELNNNLLVFNNMYGIKIAQHDLKKIKGRKVKYVENRSSMFVFGKKYHKFIAIRFSSSEGDFSLNGYILSNNGLRLFIRKTKK